MLQRLKKRIQTQVIEAFLKSHSPVFELGLGAFVGTLWAFTPLVGIQMLLVLGTWLFLRLFKINFFLSGAMALIWISNPFTMAPMYFGFYFCGYSLLSCFDSSLRFIQYDDFNQVLNKALQMDMQPALVYWFDYIYDALLWPMSIGTLVTAPPAGALGCFLTVYFVNCHRKKQAEKLGLTLKQWEEQFVSTNNS